MKAGIASQGPCICNSPILQLISKMVSVAPEMLVRACVERRIGHFSSTKYQNLQAIIFYAGDTGTRDGKVLTITGRHCNSRKTAIAHPQRFPGATMH